MGHVRGHYRRGTDFRRGTWVEPHWRNDRQRAVPPVPPPAPPRSCWAHRNDDFTRPSSCPVCRADVFFVRHNGGRVWFDELEPPWQKHGCFDEAPSVAGYRAALMQRLQPSFRSWLGVILETVVTRPGIGGRIVVRCSDGVVIDEEFETYSPLSGLCGLLVVVTRCTDGWIRLHMPAADHPAQSVGVSPPGTPNQAAHLTGGASRFSATHSPPRPAGR